MPEGVKKLPFGFEVSYDFSSRQDTQLSIARRVYTSRKGSIFARQITPIINETRVLGFGLNRIIFPSRTKSLYLSFGPQGKEIPPENFSMRSQILKEEITEYLDFLQVLSNPRNFKGITVLTGISNFIMANFAVRKLGFHLVEEREYWWDPRAKATTEIFGIREQLVEKREDISNWSKILNKRYG